jgi:hypothetical protein
VKPLDDTPAEIENEMNVDVIFRLIVVKVGLLTKVVCLNDEPAEDDKAGQIEEN